MHLDVQDYSKPAQVVGLKSYHTTIHRSEF